MKLILTTAKNLGKGITALIILFLFNNYSVFGQCPDPVIYGDTMVCPNDTAVYYTQGGPKRKYNWVISGHGGIIQGKNDSIVKVYWYKGWKFQGELSLYVVDSSSAKCYGQSTVNIHPVLGEPKIIGPTYTCRGRTYTYEMDTVVSSYTYNWIANGGTIQQISSGMVNVTWDNSAQFGDLRVIYSNGACLDTTFYGTGLIGPTTNLPDAVICGTPVLQLQSDPNLDYVIISSKGEDSIAELTYPNPDTGQHIIKSYHKISGCEWVDTINVSYDTSNNIDLDRDVLVCKGKLATIGEVAEPGFTYKWYRVGGSTAPVGTSSPIAVSPGTYRVIKEFSSSCISTDTISVLQIDSFTSTYHDTVGSGQIQSFSILGLPLTTDLDTSNVNINWTVVNGEIINRYANNLRVDIRWGLPGIDGEVTYSVSNGDCTYKVTNFKTILEPIKFSGQKVCGGTEITYRVPDSLRKWYRQWWKETSTGVDSLSKDSVLVIKPKKTAVYGLRIVKGTWATGAELVGTFLIEVIDSNACECGGDKLIFDLKNSVPCIGTTAKYEAPEHYQGANYIYRWWWRDGAVSDTFAVDTTMAEINPVSSRVYGLTIRDTAGDCAGSDTFLIGIDSTSCKCNPSFSTTSQYYIDTVCLGDSLQIHAPAGGISYAWLSSTDMSDTTSASPWVNTTVSNTYFVIVNLNDTCSFLDSVAVIVDIGCVWPGDANASNIADFTDLLNVGIAYGDTGYAREYADTSWRAQHAADWANSFSSGLNHKHADCNGDGMVDSLDVHPIAIHFGKSHQKTQGKQGKPGDPELFFTYFVDSAQAGDTVDVTVMLGRDSIVKDVYGIVFELDLSMEKIKAVTTDFAQSWMGSQTKILTLSRYDQGSAKLTVGMVRTDQKSIFGKGPIGTLSVVLPDNIGGKRRISGIWYINPLEILLVDANGNQLPVYSTRGELKVYQEETSILEAIRYDGSIAVYPNPVGNVLHIVAEEVIKEVRIYNLLGEEVCKLSPQAKAAVINTEQLSACIYTIQVRTHEGIESVKVIRK